MSIGGPVFLPQVPVLPGTVSGSPNKGQAGVKGSGETEFNKVFDRALKEQIREPVKFSSHATQRMHERKIKLDPVTMGKVKDAIDKAAAKGIVESLVITPDAALIVSVKNRTVITALDRESLAGNVFSNIDGAVIV